MPPQSKIMPPAAQKHRVRRVMSIIYGVLVLPAAGIGMISLFAFDAPGSEDVAYTQLFAMSAGALPFALIIACIGGLACASGEQTRAKVIAGRVLVWLPVADIAVLILSNVLLATFCGGSFDCVS